MTAHESRRIWASIASWSGFWVILIGGIGAIFAWGSIKDARLRIELAAHGIHSTAVLTDKRCARGSLPILRVTTVPGRTSNACAADDYITRSVQHYPPGTNIDIVYKPGHPRVFVITQGGLVPQRDVSDVWQRWLRQTLAILTIYLPVIAIYIWARRRQAR